MKIDSLENAFGHKLQLNYKNMIYTFTPNPAVDYYISIDNFETDKINRISACSFKGGGKGINCSLLLDLLKIDNTACYFSGGFTGRYIDESLQGHSYIKTMPIQTEGITRVNVKFVGEQDTAINAPGPEVSEKAKEELFAFADSCDENDYFLISGSLPPGFSKSDLLAFCRKINEKGCRLILDVPDISVEELKAVDVFLIKPNLEEFSELLSKEITIDNFREHLDEILDLGVDNILLSLGRHGSYYAGEFGRYAISVPNVQAYSPVGAGDSTLAGFIGALSEGKDIVEALKVANASGVAKVKYENLDTRDKIQELLDEIRVEKE